MFTNNTSKSSEDNTIDKEKIEETEEVIKENNLEEKCQEYLSGWKRALADYENLKKESAQKQTELAGLIRNNVIEELLPIYNHFKMALDHIPAPSKQESWIEGIAHIQKQFKDFLKNNGVEEIKTVGEKFDHNFHEAVGSEQKDGTEEEVILKELSPGYKIRDKVIQHAKVVVNKK